MHYFVYSFRFYCLFFNFLLFRNDWKFGFCFGRIVFPENSEGFGGFGGKFEGFEGNLKGFGGNLKGFEDFNGFVKDFEGFEGIFLNFVKGFEDFDFEGFDSLVSFEGFGYF